MAPHSLFQVPCKCAFFPLFLRYIEHSLTVIFQEDLKVSFDPGAFQGSLKSQTVHVKAKYTSIHRTLGLKFK